MREIAEEQGDGVKETAQQIDLGRKLIERRVLRPSTWHFQIAGCP
jgi:hypothetical protein